MCSSFSLNVTSATLRLLHTRLAVVTVVLASFIVETAVFVVNTTALVRLLGTDNAAVNV